MRSLALLLLISSAPLAAAQEEGIMLHMLEYSYEPDPLEVPAGATILAMNFGPADQSLPREQWSEFVHSVTSSTDPALFDVRAIQPDGQPYPFAAPATPGTYPYYCRYHGDAQGNGMVGTLVVTQPAPATPPPADGVGERETPAAPPVALLALAGAAALLLRRRA